MKAPILPPPRWFREAVLTWLADYPPDSLRHHVGALYTQVVNSQPPDLRVVGGTDVHPKGKAP